nr:winged helix-turn-helix domain-containing protein [uncultured Flavobacterium sp.]
MKIIDEKPTSIQIKLSAHPRVPKYVQVADSIAKDILTYKIKQGQRLPSINDLSHSSSFSRDTIEKAYKVLKERDLIFAIHNVGYFATTKKV